MIAVRCRRSSRARLTFSHRQMMIARANERWARMHYICAYIIYKYAAIVRGARHTNRVVARMMWWEYVRWWWDRAGIRSWMHHLAATAASPRRDFGDSIVMGSRNSSEYPDPACPRARQPPTNLQTHKHSNTLRAREVKCRVLRPPSTRASCRVTAAITMYVWI